MTFSGKKLAAAVLVLLAIQTALVAVMVHRESLTWDEGDHMFAGYMMWKTGDYGLNPEHPPLVKLLATIPALHEKLWIPPLKGRFFKAEAYEDGRDWLARNDGASQRLVFRMRLAAGLLAWGLTLMVFFAGRAWFGNAAALIALTLVVFDPNIMANSALVTTDVGVSLFFLATIFAFYRWATQPALSRLLLAGLAAGLLAATKHSGILIAPMLLPVIVYEIFRAERGTRLRQTLRLCFGFAATVVIAVPVLWAFYGFRYAARPAGLALSTSLADYVAPLNHFDSAVVMGVAHLHLLPESYLMGMVDVKRVAEFYPAYIFGTVHAHGVWYYFPAVILIKTTLGILALCALAIWAALTGKIGKTRELVWLLTPGAVYLLIAMLSGIDIGARHILPLYAMAAIFAGAGAAALSARSRAWTGIVAVLIAAHIAASLVTYPNEMAFANMAWGGAKNAHNLLSDASVDWAQQLYQVKAWQDQHPSEECWFAYFARPEIDPATYGIRCHALPTPDTMWTGTSDVTPPILHGAVIISAGDLSGCEWPSGGLNPYRDFQELQPTEVIDDSVFVYRGDLHAEKAASLDRAQAADVLLAQHQPQQALALAQQAVDLVPGYLFAETALGDAEVRTGNKEAARAAWQSAIAAARQLEPDAQVNYIPDLEAKLARL
jgi:tetratricopeptide (TPR) repeat protein